MGHPGGAHGHFREVSAERRRAPDQWVRGAPRRGGAAQKRPYPLTPEKMARSAVTPPGFGESIIMPGPV